MLESNILKIVSGCQDEVKYVLTDYNSYIIKFDTEDVLDRSHNHSYAGFLLNIQGGLLTHK